MVKTLVEKVIEGLQTQFSLKNTKIVVNRANLFTENWKSAEYYRGVAVCYEMCLENNGCMGQSEISTL